FDHLVKFKRLHGIAGHQTHGVANEITEVMILKKVWILREDGALLGIIRIAFESHPAIPARAAKEFEHHLQQIEIPLFVELRSLEHPGKPTGDVLKDVERVRNQERTHPGSPA